MKRVFYLAAVLFISESVIAQSVQDEPSIQQEITAILKRQVDGWNSGDIELFMQGYLRSDSLRFASGGNVTFGWNNMLERYKKNYSSKEIMGVLSFTDVTIDVISTNAALVFGRWNVKRQKDEPHGLFSLLFKKQNGEWRIVHDHTSSAN